MYLCCHGRIADFLYLSFGDLSLSDKCLDCALRQAGLAFQTTRDQRWLRRVPSFLVLLFRFPVFVSRTEPAGFSSGRRLSVHICVNGYRHDGGDGAGGEVGRGYIVGNGAGGFEGGKMARRNVGGLLTICRHGWSLPLGSSERKLTLCLEEQARLRPPSCLVLFTDCV